MAAASLWICQQERIFDNGGERVDVPLPWPRQRHGSEFMTPACTSFMEWTLSYLNHPKAWRILQQIIRADRGRETIQTNNNIDETPDS